MQKIETWLDIPKDSDFSIYNLPFGIFSTVARGKRIGVAIGDQVIDLSMLAKKLKLDKEVVENEFLNDFIALGKDVSNGVRLKLQEWLSGDEEDMDVKAAMLSMDDAVMHLPVKVGDYTDFYSSIEHATNVGIMFRGKENALMPNWKHIPVGYHGRASSIIPSGQSIHRPKGQMLKAKGDTQPIFGASKRLDMELEMGFIVGKSTELGQTVPTDKANEHIFGMVLFNDWSARDIQAWEYVPLGPFLGKSFASHMSTWVVTMEALEYFRVAQPEQTPAVLPYLETKGDQNIDIKLEVGLTPPAGEETIICNSNYKYMYWNQTQQLAHHTINGCNLNVGDLMASGTISGKDESSYGSMLELAWMGTKPLTLKDGTTRVFFNDGDTVTMRGHCEKDGMRVGFGEVTAEILPAN